MDASAQTSLDHADGCAALPAAPHGAGPSAAAPTRDAVLSVLLRHGEATAADLAHQLGVSVQAMRRHLRGLEDDGLLESTTQHDGPGRPSNHWRLTSAGRGRFPDGSEQFAMGLMQSMAASLPPGALQQVLQEQAVAKATDYRRLIGGGPLRERLERLVDLRRREGYVAECLAETSEDGGPESGSWLLSEFHCSVMRIAEQFPLVCDQELQLIRHTFPDCQVERVHWRLDAGHSCGFRITPGATPT